MRTMKLWYAMALSLILTEVSAQRPTAIEPIPSPQQVAWQQMEFYMFVHFNMNTFNGQEWGYGDTPAQTFNPTQLDTRQWARIAKENGMTGIILTAKHHDGFCLWPSEFTDYSVKNARWKKGKGDVVADLAAACKEYGLKMGVYLSPWDRNHPDYGRPEYITYFRSQLRELLTNYGEVFEVWFDGANGGDGYYGGANEVRKVDKQSYYDWPNTIKIVRELQPKAIVFSDAGPDCRWVGNEDGRAAETTWSPLLRDKVYPGMPEYARQYAKGQENGTHWVPAETDVSIRPGWYYHPNEDDKVKTLQELLDIYYESVGRNTTLLLNFPVDQRGIIHENDERQLKKLTAQLQLDFEEDLVSGRTVTSTKKRGKGARYEANHTTDGDYETYWTTDEGTTSASLTIDFEEPTTFNRFLVQEYIPLGQRVKRWTLEAQIKGEWETIDSQTTIGYKRILRFEDVTATKVRLNILDARSSPLISTIEVYNAPAVVDVPTVRRNKSGEVSLLAPDDEVQIYYTVDGTEPSLQSASYTQPLLVDKPTWIKAIAFDPKTQRLSDVQSVHFDVSHRRWSSELPEAIDENSGSNAVLTQNSLTIDLGEELVLHGFAYTPDQSRYPHGVITNYVLELKSTSKNPNIESNRWRPVAIGEFPNMANNPVRQEIRFNEPHVARFIRFKAKQLVTVGEEPIVAEIDVITE
ncbi:MAG: alpha-L-fucosidase [Bacteroidota bacterium]